jgi:hypothetical protein
VIPGLARAWRMVHADFGHDFVVYAFAL